MWCCHHDSWNRECITGNRCAVRECVVLLFTSRMRVDLCIEFGCDVGCSFV